MEPRKSIAGQSVALPAAHQPRIRRIPPWTLVVILLPIVALIVSAGSPVGRLLVLLFLVWLPVPVIIGVVGAVATLVFALAVLLWRAAFNSGSSFFGYLNRIIAAAAVGVLALAVLGSLAAFHSTTSGPRPQQAYVGKTPGETLLLAAKNADLRTVKKMLDGGVDVDTRETARANLGRTALHYAAERRIYSAPEQAADVAKLLIARGANVNAKADGGYTPLHVASGYGQAAIVELLLASGADPNALDVRGTPLHAAVVQGQREVVALLLKHGADVNAPGPGRLRPLNQMAHIAAWYPSHDEIAEMLVAAGATLTTDEDNRQSPLAIAVRRDRKKLAMFIVEHGAPVDDGVVSALGTYGQKEVVQFLLAKNLIAFDTPVEGAILLHGAACFSGDDFFDWVLSNTKDVNHADKEGETPLHKAVRCSKARYVEALLARGANVQIKDKKGSAPIAELSAGATAILRYLIKAGADPNEVGRYGTPVLMAAAYRNDVDTARLLIASGADVNARNRSGRTALHEAARLGKEEIAEVLLSARTIKLDEADPDGRTALHFAAEQGAPKFVQLLLQHGADRLKKTGKGQTPAELAEARGFKEVAAALAR